MSFNNSNSNSSSDTNSEDEGKNGQRSLQMLIKRSREVEEANDVIYQLEGMVEKQTEHIAYEVKRGNMLSDLLEDITLDADERRREFTTLMEQADECLRNEMLKSDVKGQMVNYLLDRIICLNGGQQLPKLGRWWATFAEPLLLKECETLSKADPSHQCFQCFTHSPVIEESISLTDLFAEEEEQQQHKRSKVEINV